MQEIAKRHLLCTNRGEVISDLQRRLGAMGWRLNDLRAAVIMDAPAAIASLSPEQRQDAVRKDGWIVRYDIVASVER